MTPSDQFRDAIEKVNSAVRIWSEQPSRLGCPRIAWGGANEDDQKLAESWGTMPALLDYDDHAYQLSIWRASGENRLDCCTIQTEFSDWPGIPKGEHAPALPRGSARWLFNALCCAAGCSVRLFPDVPRTIVALGCETTIPVEAISAPVLRDALLRLRESTDEVAAWLLKGEGIDHWRIALNVPEEES